MQMFIKPQRTQFLQSPDITPKFFNFMFLRLYIQAFEPLQI